MKLYYHSRLIQADEKILNNENNANKDDGIVVAVSIGDDCSLISSYNVNKNKQANVTPKEMLYTSVASCTIMTIRTYYNNCILSKTNFWSSSTLNKIEVQVKENNEMNHHIPDSIDIYIKMIGDLSNEQKDRLLIASKKCPVKQMISTSINSYII